VEIEKHKAKHNTSELASLPAFSFFHKRRYLSHPDWILGDGMQTNINKLKDGEVSLS